MATAQFRTRIDLDLKRKSSAILKSIDLNESSFVSMALTQLVNRRLPFAVTESDHAYFEAEYGLTPAEKKAGLKTQWGIDFRLLFQREGDHLVFTSTEITMPWAFLKNHR